MRKIFILLFIFSAFTCKGENTSYIPLKIKKPPVIDGNFDEAIWKEARKVNSFIMINGEKPSQQTSVSICYDTENLYFGIICEEENIDNLVIKFKKHDEPLWTDDCIEIFIAPDYLNRKNYFHFISNAAGIKYEEKAGMMGYYKEWNGEWEAKTKIKKDRWQVEIKIPFESIGIKKISEKDILGMSVCRERWAGKKEYTVWAAGGGFHKPDGHFLFTSYKSYLEKKVFPLWEREKKEITPYFKHYPEVKERFIKEFENIIYPVNSEEKILKKKEKVESEEFNSFFQKFEKALEDIKGLKRKIEFTSSFMKLKKIIQ